MWVKSHTVTFWRRPLTAVAGAISEAGFLIDPLVEAMDMKEAQRTYEANLNVVTTTRQMLSRTLDILKS